jgi:exodeoxyribonuclease VIII
MSVCPAYFKWHEENPQKKSDELLEGSAFHKLVLEPDTFDDEYVVAPHFDRRTKVGKQEYVDFCDMVASTGKEVLTEEQYKMICGMRDAVMENPYCRKLIKGNIEQSMYFVDDATGVQCKIRPDIWRKLDDSIIIIDLKSTRSALPMDFARDVVKFHYDLQAYMYSYGASKTLGVPMDKISFVFIAVEKKPPYLINVMQACSDVIEKGGADFREYIGMYADCMRTGNWYGLNGSHDVINDLMLPQTFNKK